jgi:hypothetical protein
MLLAHVHLPPVFSLGGVTTNGTSVTREAVAVLGVDVTLDVKPGAVALAANSAIPSATGSCLDEVRSGRRHENV